MSEEQKEPTLDYQLLCQIVGQLFLESRVRVEKMSREIVKLRQENQELLKLLPGNPSFDDPSTT